VIATVTPGEDLSHASLYDAEHGTVIEVVGDGVREHDGGGSARGGGARAHQDRSKFDKAGMFGFNNPEAFYCSELVY
jgi:hypothetical protein